MQSGMVMLRALRTGFMRNTVTHRMLAKTIEAKAMLFHDVLSFLSVFLLVFLAEKDIMVLGATGTSF